MRMRVGFTSSDSALTDRSIVEWPKHVPPGSTTCDEAVMRENAMDEDRSACHKP